MKPLLNVIVEGHNLMRRMVESLDSNEDLKGSLELWRGGVKVHTWSFGDHDTFERFKDDEE